MSETADMAEAIAAGGVAETNAWRAERMAAGEPFEVSSVTRHETPYWQYAAVLDAASGAPVEHWQAADAPAGWVDLLVPGEDGRYLRDPASGRLRVRREARAIRIVLTPAPWMADNTRSRAIKTQKRKP